MNNSAEFIFPCCLVSCVAATAAIVAYATWLYLQGPGAETWLAPAAMP